MQIYNKQLTTGFGSITTDFKHLRELRRSIDNQLSLDSN